MQIDFRTLTHFALLDGESNVIAVIECPKGEFNITEKLKQVVSEEYNSESVELFTDNVLDLYDYDISFEAELTDEDGEVDRREFKLVRTFIY